MAITFCSLGSGSKGNSYLVADENNKILIDAGFSSKIVETRLESIGVKPNEINGIVITHEHSDHISGVNVFSRKFDIPVYANEKTMLAMLKKCGGLDEKNIRIFNNNEDFHIGRLDITPFKTPHDSVCSCGFSVFSKGCKVTVATDLGHVTKRVVNACVNSDILVLEANHDIQMLLNGPYTQFLKQRVQGPNGHLSNDLCGKTIAYLLDYGIKQVFLAHLSKENNTHAIALETVCSHIEQRGAKNGVDVNIETLMQDAPSKCYRIN